jgi:hypothetical protein
MDYEGSIVVQVNDAAGDRAPIDNANVTVHLASSPTTTAVFTGFTGQDGRLEHEFDPGSYQVTCEAFGISQTIKSVEVKSGCATTVSFDQFKLGVTVSSSVTTQDCGPHVPCDTATAGAIVNWKVEHQNIPKPVKYEWSAAGGSFVESPDQLNKAEVHLNTAGAQGSIPVTLTVSEIGSASLSISKSFTALPARTQSIGGNVAVTMRRTATAPTPDLPLWVVIRKSTDAISFDSYLKFMDLVLCGIDRPLNRKQDVRNEFANLRKRRFLPYNDADAYRLLKVATEAFLLINCAVFLAQPNFTQADLDNLINNVSLDGRITDLNALNALWQSYLQFVNGSANQTIPYLALIRDKLRDQGRLKNSIFAAEDPTIDLPEECFGILRTKLTTPCLLELIWSYWHEEGMLVQTMNAISTRFQNVRGPANPDPLAMLEIDPLRPLNNLLWGYLQDEQHRLSVVRRAYEYDHHYGLTLYGKAVPALRTADSRSQFLEAFHSLLYFCWIFFKEDDDTTVIADGFPVLNALKEVHLLLTEGAHNQFGDLPSTARQEMLLQQWILARPEFREFLPTRIMVAYPEPWMDRVDAMKRLQGWTDVSVREFHELGVFGERILLSVRFGAWLTVDDPVQASNWARFWRPEIQGYIHSYRSVAGVDLTTEVTDSRQAALRSAQPALLLRQRLAAQRQRAEPRR